MTALCSYKPMFRKLGCDLLARIRVRVRVRMGLWLGLAKYTRADGTLMCLDIGVSGHRCIKTKCQP